ncbi:Domain of unknown function DUF1990 [Segniliparus rotundus DSM 44985]|uniref:DUF1990 domain-containing protein n=1 Tax=Segniliparus rotundus (strain ATCC BAA-972 / CDC 1076 / CIP 108378 / DSM 44985 / JCM 13578) TaxID=640132 RepID=D6ZA40_SEGRD|nr:DUF1990 domain-containing protein [Segniliparus rotundus]ADG98710.1 Domain of unknown function DUF1990 [Segniliparus rotundus DSM 44985]
MALRGRYVPLPPDQAMVLRAAAFSSPASGVTRDAAPRPMFFLPLTASRVVGAGEADFHRAAVAVLTWQAQLRAGLSVHASASFVAEGAVVDQRLGPFSFPCRVVYVVDEPRRKGFAYGALPGHAERGEELFAVSWDPQTDEVRVLIHSVSLPAPLWLPLFPLLRIVQHVFARRFVAAIAQAAQEGIPRFAPGAQVSCEKTVKPAKRLRIS